MKARVIPSWEDKLSGWVTKYPAFFKMLGNIETRALLLDESEHRIDRPIYVCGLARAGTTILLELLASHKETVTHQYRDFPFVFTPFWWNWFLDRAGRNEFRSVERFHNDRIMVTPESPEAMEEILWMAFWPQCHDKNKNNVLDGETEYSEFERFYRWHIIKLLRIRGGSRYVAKGNYNVSRLAYLRRIFPDARFVVAVRDPVNHVASLMKQHRIFRQAEQRDRRILNYMHRSGHFEFGLDFRPINCGNAQQVNEILEYFDEGNESLGWALYWAAIYEFLATQLQRDEDLRRSTIVVDYDDVCRASSQTLRNIYEHCELDVDPEILSQQTLQLSPPRYYHKNFSEGEELQIRAATARVYALIRRFCPSCDA